MHFSKTTIATTLFALASASPLPGQDGDAAPGIPENQPSPFEGPYWANIHTEKSGYMAVFAKKLNKDEDNTFLLTVNPGFSSNDLFRVERIPDQDGQRFFYSGEDGESHIYASFVQPKPAQGFSNTQLVVMAPPRRQGVIFNGKEISTNIDAGFNISKFTGNPLRGKATVQHGVPANPDTIALCGSGETRYIYIIRAGTAAENNCEEITEFTLKKPVLA